MYNDVCLRVPYSATNQRPTAMYLQVMIVHQFACLAALNKIESSTFLCGDRYLIATIYGNQWHVSK